jgi:hypothetical protein
MDGASTIQHTHYAELVSVHMINTNCVVTMVMKCSIFIRTLAHSAAGVSKVKSVAITHIMQIT